MEFIRLIAAECTPSGGSLLGLPKWYKYLGGIETEGLERPNAQTGELEPVILCSPQVSGINDIWLIGAAIIEILLRIAVLLAIGFIVYAGVKYITSQGQPDQTAVALRTLLNAIAGLVITVAATAIVSFVAGRFN